jgi:hypothetical protein
MIFCLARVWGLLFSRQFIRNWSAYLAPTLTVHSLKYIPNELYNVSNLDHDIASRYKVNHIKTPATDSSDGYLPLKESKPIESPTELASPVVTNKDPHRLQTKSTSVIECGRHLHKQYFSGKTVDGKPIHWTEKLNRDGIVVCSSTIEGSEWKVIKATISFPAKINDVLKTILDDNKVKCFDEMFEDANVCTLQY